MALTNEVKVGVFVSVALAVLIGLTFYIGGVNIFKPGYKLNVVFDSAPELKARSKVKYGGGVNIGRVTQLYINADRKICVELYINKEEKLRRDSDIRVYSSGVMGEKYINVSGGSAASPFVEPGETLMGKSSGGIDAAVDSINQVSAEFKDVLNALNKIVSGVQGSLVSSMQNVNDLTKATKGIVEKSAPAITRSVENFEKTSQELAAATKNLQELTNQLNTIIKDVNKSDLPKTMENLNKVSLKLDETVAALDSAAKKIDKGDGTLSVLINDKTMAEDLKTLIKDVKENPWKILWKK